MIIKVEDMIKVEYLEDVPCGVDLLVYNGCDYEIDHTDVCVDTGSYFWSNGSDATHYAELKRESL